jgi:DNA (cytosine-5)-methyltransferase 1
LPRIDIIYGGFPCQDISIAGRGAGLEGERSGLFFQIMRLAKQVKPSFIFLENVAAITGRGGLRVVREITSLGYDCRWCVISAASVGAMHRRERWFLLAHADHNGKPSSEGGGSIEEGIASRKQHEQEKSIGEAERTSSLSTYVADSESKGLSGFRRECKRSQEKKPILTMYGENGICNSDVFPSLQADQRAFSFSETKETRREYSGFYWPFESRDDWQEAVRRMDKCSDGIPSQVDCIKALGNAVVPQQVTRAFETLIGIS